MQNIHDIHIHMRFYDQERVEKFLKTMADSGVTKMGMQALPYHSPINNLVMLYWKQKCTDIECTVFGGMHRCSPFEDEPYESQAKRLLDMGCEGIKLIDMCPTIRKDLPAGIDAPEWDAMFTLLEERGVPVLIHVADPEEYWNPHSARVAGEPDCYLDDSYLTKHQLYEEAFRMLEKHPRLKVILAHFFFLSNEIDEAYRIMDRYPNVCLDMTPGWEMFLGFSKDIPAWREFFVKYRTRIFFGTDCNSRKNFNAEIIELVSEALTHDESEFKMPCYGGHIIRGLGLDEETVDCICRKNYDAMLPEMKPVDRAAMLADAKHMLTVLEGIEKYEPECEWLRALIREYEDLV